MHLLLTQCFLIIRWSVKMERDIGLLVWKLFSFSNPSNSPYDLVCSIDLDFYSCVYCDWLANGIQINVSFLDFLGLAFLPRGDPKVLCENNSICAHVLPEAGGQIWHPEQQRFLWHWCCQVSVWMQWQRRTSWIQKAILLNPAKHNIAPGDSMNQF